MWRKENIVSKQEETSGAGARAVTQVRDGEEAAGIAAQHRKQTESLFLAGLGRADKGPCCELNAACSWQPLSAALQAELCLSASASISLEISISTFTHPFYQKSLGQQQRRTKTSCALGSSDPKIKAQAPLLLYCAPSTSHALLLLNITTRLLCKEIYIKNYDVLRQSH